MDHDVKDTLQNIGSEEKILNHVIEYVDPKDRPKGPPQNYFVPNFGVDHDIKSVLDETSLAEKKFGAWKVTPKKERPAPHPVDYFVPSFGQDPEITQAIENEELARIEVWEERLTGNSDAKAAFAKLEVQKAEAIKAAHAADAARAVAEQLAADTKEAEAKMIAEKLREDITAVRI